MKSLKDKIYDLMYKKSVVDGVRIIHEDEWPIDGIVSLLSKEIQECVGEDETPESYMPKVLTEKEFSTAYHAVQFQARNNLRHEIRTELKEKGLI